MGGWIMTDEQAPRNFDQIHQVQNVRVVNRLSLIETALAVALGVAGGGIALVIIAAAMIG